MTRIRVLVVDDSLTVRKHLAEVLSKDPELEVVAEGEDGKQAIELCERLRPDVVTLDMVMQKLSGLAATEYIMAYCPTPIVIVSASTNRGELFKTYEALAAGAVEVMEKPLGDTYDGGWEQRFVSTVKLVSRLKVITHPRARLRALMDTHAAAARPATEKPSRRAYTAPRLRVITRPTARLQALMSAHVAASRRLATKKSSKYECVALGISTGGPQALALILSGLPKDFPLPLLLVMHISPAFGAAFAEWLNEHSSIPVATATHGEPIPPVGKAAAILAPPDRHLIVSRGRLWLTDDREVHSCRPSVDVLFESVAQELGDRAIAGVLTGMGRDGARGLLAIRRAGGMTFAQDEASSVVFGMPREAIALQAAQRVLPLDEVAPTLITLAGISEAERRRS